MCYRLTVLLVAAANLACPAWGAVVTSSLFLEGGFQGTAVESINQQARTTGVVAELDWEATVGTMFSTHIRGGALLETGAHRTRFNDEFAPRQGLRLREAALRFNPIRSLTVSVGAIDQNRWENRLLLQDQSFPSLMQEAVFESGDWTLALSAQQAFVADSSLVQPWGEWQQGPAQFFMERVAVTWGKQPREHASLHISHFTFADLSSALADRSRYLGNRIEGLGPIASRFASAFSGVEAGLSARIPLGRFTPHATFDGVTNTLAAENDLALRAEVGVGIGFADFDVQPYAEWFAIQENAVPAVFNDRALGHTNRSGYGAGARFTLPKEGIEATLRWTHAPRITPRFEQSDLDYVSARLIVRTGLL